MLTPEGPRAEVDHDTRTILVTLLGAPDLKQKADELPFIAERARVECFTAGGMHRVTVVVTGRAIRRDGEIGKAQRWRAYNLRAANWLEGAPGWLFDVLRAAGVAW